MPASGWAINAALDSLAIPIATAIELGTAGAGTLAVGAFLIAKLYILMHFNTLTNFTILEKECFLLYIKCLL